MVETRFVNGTNESLDGRVIIYCRNTCPLYLTDAGIVKPRKNSIIAFLYSNDSKALFDRVPEYEEELDGLLKDESKYIIFMNNVKIPKRVIKEYIDGKLKGFALGQEIEIKDEDFTYFSEDVFFAGEYPNYDECVKRISTISDYYYKKLDEQLKAPVTYEDFSGIPMEDFLKQRFTNKMTASSMQKDFHIYFKLLGELKRFSKGSNFENQLPGLCDTLEEGFTANIKVYRKRVDDHASLINSLHLQELYHVILLDRKIKGLISY